MEEEEETVEADESAEALESMIKQSVEKKEVAFNAQQKGILSKLWMARLEAEQRLANVVAVLEMAKQLGYVEMVPEASDDAATDADANVDADGDGGGAAGPRHKRRRPPSPPRRAGPRPPKPRRFRWR